MSLRQSATIFIHDCRVHLSIGLNHGEKSAPQPVLISIKAEYAPDISFPDTKENSRERIIDYSVIHRFITQDLPAMGHIYLLESAAEKIIEFCFCDKNVQAVHVRLEKIAIYADAAGAGIEMSHKREVV